MDAEQVKRVKAMKHGQVLWGPKALGEDAPAILCVVDGGSTYYLVGKRKDCRSSANGTGDGDGVLWTKSASDAADRHDRAVGRVMPQAMELAFP